MWLPQKAWPRGGGPVGQVVSIKRAADGCTEIVDKKREKNRAKNTTLRNSSLNLNGVTSVILKTMQERLSKRED